MWRQSKDIGVYVDDHSWTKVANFGGKFREEDLRLNFIVRLCWIIDGVMEPKAQVK